MAASPGWAYWLMMWANRMAEPPTLVPEGHVNGPMGGGRRGGKVGLERQGKVRAHGSRKEAEPPTLAPDGPHVLV